MAELVQRVTERVRELVNCQQQSVAHRFDHLERVMRNAMALASTIEDVDYELLQLSVLLHDVDQPAGRKQEHVILSMRRANKILVEVGYTRARIQQVLETIGQHSTEHIETIKPGSNEAKILFDADKLDGVGEIGIARVFALFGQNGRSPFEAIAWYREKVAVSLCNLQTQEGRRLFESKLNGVQTFLQQMESER